MGIGWGKGLPPILASLDSCFRGNDGLGWLGVVEMFEGVGCLVWIPAFAGMTEGVGGGRLNLIAPSQFALALTRPVSVA